jgi:peptidoglycan/LPS O-acetylase OafA/YrhL
VEKVEMGCLTIRPAPPAGADPSGTIPAWRFLFVPQSWAISIELLFYLVVPWLVSWGPGTCSCWPARASCPISPTAFLCIRPCPIYVCHILVKWGLLALAGVSKKGVTSPPGWLLLLCATAMAALLLWLVDYPIDRWRQGRVKSLQRQPRPAAAT